METNQNDHIFTDIFLALKDYNYKLCKPFSFKERITTGEFIHSGIFEISEARLCSEGCLVIDVRRIMTSCNEACPLGESKSFYGEQLASTIQWVPQEFLS